MQRGSSSLKTLLNDFAKSRDLWPLQVALGIGAGMGVFAIFHTAKAPEVLINPVRRNANFPISDEKAIRYVENPVRRFVENKNEMMKIFPPYSARTQGSTPLPKLEDLYVDPEAEINQYHETKLHDVL